MLRQHRPNDVTQELVAKFYRDGVTRGRISQIETSSSIDSEIHSSYLRAVEAAIAWKQKVRRRARSLAAEMAMEYLHQEEQVCQE